MSTQFVYRKRDTKAWQKRASQQGGDYHGFIKDQFTTFAPSKGDNWVRILPPTWDGAEHYGMDIWVHYQVGPEKASVLCNQKMLKQACPLCEAKVAAERGGDEDLERALKPARRVLVWILDQNEPKDPVAWAMPWTLDRDISKICVDERDGQVYCLDDPQEGFDLSFTVEGEGMMKKYVGVRLARRSTSVPQEALDWVLAFPLPEIVVQRTYDEVKALFTGIGGGSELNDAPPVEAPAREGPAPRETRARREAPPREDPRDEGPREREVAEKATPQRRAPRGGNGKPKEAPFDDDDATPPPPPPTSEERISALKARIKGRA